MKSGKRIEHEELLRSGKFPVLEDGETYHVPLQFMDALQRAIAMNPMGPIPSSRHITDSGGQLSGNRPGFCFSHGLEERGAQAAYTQYVEQLCDAWRGSPVIPPKMPPRGGDDMRDQYLHYIANAWRM
jgi:hypothetical protein